MEDEYKKNFIKAGELAKIVRAFGKSLIQTGASYNDVIDKIHSKIRELGAYPAFPPQIALNEIAAHFLPRADEDIIFRDEVIKLDIGICYQGAIGDCAVTIDLSGKYQNLIDAVETALLNAERIIEVGLPIRKIGKVIHETITSFGFKTVKNLSGHGLGSYQIHTSPIIPNYDNRTTATIRPGMTFAIEPFATDGKGLIYETGNPSIYSLNAIKAKIPGKWKPLFEKIQTFQGLPFAIRDLLDDDFLLARVEKELDQMEQKGILTGYAPLVEEENGFVAQAENSVLIDDDGKVLITTR